LQKKLSSETGESEREKSEARKSTEKTTVADENRSQLAKVSKKHALLTLV
jgi:hypothetical protein